MFIHCISCRNNYSDRKTPFRGFSCRKDKNCNYRFPELQIEDIDNSNFKILVCKVQKQQRKQGFLNCPFFLLDCYSSKRRYRNKSDRRRDYYPKRVYSKPVFATKEQEIASEYNKTAYHSASLYPANSYSYSQPPNYP